MGAVEVWKREGQRRVSALFGPSTVLVETACPNCTDKHEPNMDAGLDVSESRYKNYRTRNSPERHDRSDLSGTRRHKKPHKPHTAAEIHSKWIIVSTSAQKNVGIMQRQSCFCKLSADFTPRVNLHQGYKHPHSAWRRLRIKVRMRAGRCSL